MENIQDFDPVLTTPSKCLKCKKLLDMATGIDTKRPSEGDLSICFYCGNIMLFMENTSLRAPQPGELEKIRQAIIKQDPLTWRLIQKLRNSFKAKRARSRN